MASDGGGSSWPTSLGTPETDELIRLGMMVPPGCRLPRAFHITADGYPTRGPGATPDELRQQEGGRWNIIGRARFCKGKNYWVVVAQARRELRTGGSSSGPGGSSFAVRGSSSAPRRPRRPPPAAAPSPSSSRRPPPAAAPSPSSSCRPVPAIARPASPPVVEIPSEQLTLREDGDPDDYPGYLIAQRASQAEAAVAAADAKVREAAEPQAALDAAAAAEAAELQAALDAVAAIKAVQPQVAPEEGDGGYWDDGGKSSDDGDGDDDGGGEIVDLADSDDDE
ncbi:hypothetical protein VPH35_066954 [Triticum aestivum]